MPAQPVPIERMIARSNNGKTLGGRDLEVTDVSSMEKIEPPPMPSGLKTRGKQEWVKIWSSAPWLWVSQDYAWIEQACRAYDDLTAFRKEIATMGLTVEGYNGQTTANPLIKEVRAAEDTIRKCLSMLGFSPTDRARLKLTEARGATELQKLTQGAAQAPVTGYVENEW